MYNKTTKSIHISVSPYYLEDQSEPEEQHFVWAYQVTINNLGKESVQLKNRFWKITDSNGAKQEVRGEGVVGETPTIDPNEKYTYTSFCPLKTNFGSMKGHYTFSKKDGEIVKTLIPEFSLIVPNYIN